MAMIAPFTGIRYDLGQVGTLSSVVAPPYDVIDAALQQKLYDQHSNNIIRLELTRPEPGDQENQKYQRAGATWKQWQLDGVVRTEGQVSMEPPIPVQVEVPGEGPDDGLAAELETAIRARLTFRAKVELVPEIDFGGAGYKTRLTVSRD